jgi:hypothetical protein
MKDLPADAATVLHRRRLRRRRCRHFSDQLEQEHCRIGKLGTILLLIPYNLGKVWKALPELYAGKNGTRCSFHQFVCGRICK